MIVLVDGSNVVGRVAGSATDVEAKRELVALLASISRRRNLRIICFFDGPSPGSFATRFGRLEVRFTAPQSADERIVAEASRHSEPITVVTADVGLAVRLRRRGVTLVDSRRFLQSEPEERGDEATDWESYFSDSNNRNL